MELQQSYAYACRMTEAETAAAKVARLNPAWTAEGYLGEAGGFAAKEAETFVDGARKAGLPDCMPFDRVEGMPALVRVKSCEDERVGKAE